VQWLRRAQAQHPADFWLAFNLAFALADTDRAESAGWYRVALAIRPTSAVAYSNLGAALRDQRKLDDAVAACPKAIALDPNFAEAYNTLGLALRDQRKLDDAIAAFRQAIKINPKYAHAYDNLGFTLWRLRKLDDAVVAFRQAIKINPKYARAYHHLGVALGEQGKLDEAVAACRKAVEFDRKYAEAWYNLGFALRVQKKWDDAIAALHKAIDLEPKYAWAYFHLGWALRDQGKPDEALATFRKVVELRPGQAEAHCNVGLLLMRLGQFAQALEPLQKGHELGRRRPGWQHPSGRWVKDCERLIALEKRRPPVQADQAARPAELMSAAELFWRYTNRHADAALLYDRAVTAEPKLAEDLNAHHRYYAACCAALAARGTGAGADRLDRADRARFRGQALDWLAADLAARRKLLADDPTAVGPTQKVLQHWLDDPDLSGVRDARGLAELPDAERERWKELWSAVRDLLRRAEKK
jgi:tetratricopeptide (TPR) repeat protein